MSAEDKHLIYHIINKQNERGTNYGLKLTLSVRGQYRDNEKIKYHNIINSIKYNK